MQISSLPSRLGSHLCTEICVQGLGFSSPRRQSCTKSGFTAYIRDVHISIMCPLQRLFEGEAKAGWTPCPEGCAAHSGSGTTRGLCHTSWISHECPAPHGETPFIKHTSCWIITAPVNNPSCTYCSRQNTRIRGIVWGEQSAALSALRPCMRLWALLSHLPWAKIMTFSSFSSSSNSLSPRLRLGSCCGMDASGSNPAASLPAFSRGHQRLLWVIFWKHMESALAVRWDSSETYSCFTVRWRRAKSFYSKLLGCFWLETLQCHRIGVFSDFLCFTHKNLFTNQEQ